MTVALPRSRPGLVGPPSPEVDDGLPLQGHADSSPELASRLEAGTEHVADAPEARIAHAMNLGRLGHESFLLQHGQMCDSLPIESNPPSRGGTSDRPGHGREQGASGLATAAAHLAGREAAQLLGEHLDAKRRLAADLTQGSHDLA